MLPFQLEDEEDAEQPFGPLLMREGVRDFRPRRTKGWTTLRNGR